MSVAGAPGLNRDPVRRPRRHRTSVHRVWTRSERVAPAGCSTSPRGRKGS